MTQAGTKTDGPAPATSGRKAGFRPDIQGMRAIAVGSVLLFHGGLLGITGGYVGVDVFFVLSGFLITGLLVRELERSGRISFVDFYARRLKRLAPTYLLVLATTLVGVVSLLTPLQQLDFLPQIGWAALYAANFAFARLEGGYFAAQDPAPVLHFWSLAVEEQFYLVWPAVIMLVALLGRRHLRRNLVVALGGLAIASLVASIVLTPTDPENSYYLLHTRAWQLAAGGLLALVPAAVSARVPAWLRSALLLSGVVGVIWCSFEYTAATSFPGSAALVPVLASMCLIVSGTGGEAPGARWLLTTRPATYLGDISYSLYLWHWPILVLPVLALGHSLGTLPRVGLVLLSVAVAALNYRFVEAPLHHVPLEGHRRKIYVRSLGATALVAALAFGLTARADHVLANASTSQVPAIGYVETLTSLPAGSRAKYPGSGIDSTGRITPERRLTPSLKGVRGDLAEVFRNGCVQPAGVADAKRCDFGRTDAPRTVVLIGDSHAGQWFPALQEVADKDGWHLVTLLKNACPAVPVPLRSHPNLPGPFLCEEWQNSAWTQVAQIRPDVIVTSNYEGGYTDFPDMSPASRYDTTWLDGVRAMLGKVPQGSRLVLLSDNPVSERDPNACLSAHLDDPGACGTPPTRANRTDLQRQQASLVKAAGGSVIDIPQQLCSSDSCPVVVGNRLVYRDRSHLTPTYVRLFSPYLATALAPARA